MVKILSCACEVDAGKRVDRFPMGGGDGFDGEEGGEGLCEDDESSRSAAWIFCKISPLDCLSTASI